MNQKKLCPFCGIEFQIENVESVPEEEREYCSRRCYLLGEYPEEFVEIVSDGDKILFEHVRRVYQKRYPKAKW